MGRLVRRSEAGKRRLLAWLLEESNTTVLEPPLRDEALRPCSLPSCLLCQPHLAGGIHTIRLQRPCRPANWVSKEAAATSEDCIRGRLSTNFLKVAGRYGSVLACLTPAPGDANTVPTWCLSCCCWWLLSQCSVDNLGNFVKATSDVASETCSYHPSDFRR